MKKSILACLLLFFSAKGFATIWVISNSGTFFSPDSITIIQGDSVSFQLENQHNAQEVSQPTWDANGNLPVTGFQTPVTGGMVIGLSPGIHYYVCDPDAGFGMKGRIFVQPAPSVEFVITSSTYSEGITNFQLAVSILNPNSNPTSVDVNVLGGGTAVFGTDFTFSPLTITFPANSPTTEFVTVTIVDDIIAEGNELLTFQLASPTNNATIGTNVQYILTIMDNDTLLFDISPATNSVSENVGVVTFPVSLSNISPNNTSVTVHLETNGTTSTQGIDFYFNDTTLVWPSGAVGPIVVPITVIDDNLYEPRETVKFRLINPTNGASFVNDTFQMVIQNDDTLPSGPCANLYFSEYIEGTGNNRAVEIYNPTSLSIDLSEYSIYKSNDGGGSWWTYDLSGVIAPGGTYVGVHHLADSLLTSIANDADGFFDFSGNDALVLLHFTDTLDIIGRLGNDPGLSWPLTGGSTQDHTLIRGYYIYEGQTDWTIASATWDVYPNDMFDSIGFHHTAPCGTPKPIYPSSLHFTLLSDTVSESDGTIQVIAQIDNPNSTLVSYLLARDDNSGTASPGVDYTFVNHNFTTNSGGTTFDTVSIRVLEDQLIEPTEKVVLYFINLSPGATPVPDSTFTLYITDNDTLSTSFLGAGFSYVEKDTLVGIKVALSTFPAIDVSVSVKLAAGNADSLTDFIFNDTVLIFPAFSTDTQIVWVTLIDDNLVEQNEQINFDLIDTNGIRVGISAYTLTIVDNDSVVGILQIDFDNGLKMFPNPVINTLVIQTENNLLNAEVIDPIGNVVIHLGKLSMGRNSVDVSLLRAGMYFLNIRDEQQILSKRFVKQD